MVGNSAHYEHGRWIWGIGRNIGGCSVLQAELWVSYDGLQLAWKANWVNIIVEIDCALVIKGIHGDFRGHSNRDLILRIQELCRHEWKVVSKQIPRNVNFVVNTLVDLMRFFLWVLEFFMLLHLWLMFRYG